MMATCRECKLFDLDACKDKAGRVLRNRVGQCLWKSKEQWPISATQTGVGNRRPYAGRCQPDDGYGCPCFIKRNSTTLTPTGAHNV